METATQQTKAEIKARAMAKLLEDIGWSVEVRIERHKPEYFSDGVRVMLPEMVSAHVHARGPRHFDDRLSFGFASWMAAEGHRATTSYLGGSLYRYFVRKTSKKLTLKQLRARIASEVESYHYAKRQEV